MKKTVLASVVLGTLALMTFQQGNACSRIFWNDNGVAMVTARTLDWSHSFEDYLMVIPRGQKMNGGFEDSPQWTSKYGSLVCTIGPYCHKNYDGFDYVKDGAVEGINEKGLAIHGLYMGDTVYPSDDSSNLPPVSYMRLGRYFLDNCANVKEAVAAMKKVRVKPVKIGGKELGAHFAVEDPTGDSAIFEFVEGELVIHHGKQFTVMANEPAYSVHVDNLKEYKDFGGTKEMLPGTTDSPDRFIRAATFLSRMKKPADAVDATAKVLGIARTVQVPFDADEYGPTYYTSVTDLTNKVFYFDWTQTPNIIWVELKNLDFSEGQPVKEVNPRNPSLVGEVSGAFEPVKE